MNFICLNCGTINKQSKSLICINCSAETNISEYRKLSKYSKKVVHFGYNYRNYYEEQLKRNNKITTRPSLINPTTYYEWLGVAVLGGVIGNLTYDILKYVAFQIAESLKSKQSRSHLNHEEEQLQMTLNNRKEIKKFEKYIISYYKGLPRVNPLIKKEILEEESADLMSSLSAKLIYKNRDNPKILREEDLQKSFLKAVKNLESKNKEKENSIKISKIITKKGKVKSKFKKKK